MSNAPSGRSDTPPSAPVGGITSQVHVDGNPKPAYMYGTRHTPVFADPLGWIIGNAHVKILTKVKHTKDASP